MNNLWNKYWGIIIVIFIFNLFFIGYSIDVKNKKGIIKNSKYTIGIMTSNWHQKNGNGVGTDYVYYVNGFKYAKTRPYNLKKNERCLIMFDSLKSKNSIMLGHHQLPDDIEVPSNGWKFNEIPIPIDSADLKSYFKKLGIDYKSGF